MEDLEAPVGGRQDLACRHRLRVFVESQQTSGRRQARQQRAAVAAAAVGAVDIDTVETVDHRVDRLAQQDGPVLPVGVLSHQKTKLLIASGIPAAITWA